MKTTEWDAQKHRRPAGVQKNDVHDQRMEKIRSGKEARKAVITSQGSKQYGKVERKSGIGGMHLK